MDQKKFDVKKLDKLNNPQRLKTIPPDWVWQQLQLADARVLVDIGAGTGFFSRAFLPFTTGATVYACDISPVMIDWMRQHICPDQPAIVPLRMTEQQVPLADGLADLVFMINLHHELEEPLALLHEARRLLRDGGRLALVDWQPVAMEQGPPLAIRCRPEAVMAQLEQVGFLNVARHDGLAQHFLLTATR